MRPTVFFALLAAAVASAQSVARTSSSSRAVSGSMPASTSVSPQGPDPRFSSNVLPLVGKLDACALPCFVKYVPEVCPKGINDFYCQCTNVGKLTPIIQPCILSSCPSQNTQLHVQQIVGQICQAVEQDVASYNSLPSAQMKTYTPKATNSLVTPIPDFTMAAATLSSYDPNSANGGKAMATALPLVGAGLAALAFAL